MRVDEEVKLVIKRLQSFFRLAEGKDLTEGGTLQEILKDAVFEIKGPNSKPEYITYPFDQFEVRHLTLKEIDEK